MKKMSAQPRKSGNAKPSSPARRSFVKGIAAMGAGVAAFPLLTITAEAQVPAASDNGIPSGSSGAALRSPRVSRATRSTGTDSTATTS